MKKFLLALLLIIVIGVGAFIYLAQKTFNPATYQRQIETTVQELTGKKLTIRGGTVFSWRPLPTIVLKDVQLANMPGSVQKNMLTAANISITIDWASLFSSPLKIKNIEVANPVLVLETSETNQTNWDFPFLFSFKRPSDNVGSIINRGAVERTQIEQLHIAGGQITYVNRINNMNVTLTDISGDINVSSLKGPFSFSGNAMFQKNKLGLGIQIEQIKEDLPINFTAQVSEHKSDFVLKISGNSTPSMSSSIVNSIGEISLKKPNTFLTLFGMPELPAAADQPSIGNFTLESTLLKDHIKNFTMRLGASGNAPTFTLDLEFRKKTKETPNMLVGSFAMNELDYDVWRNTLKKFNWDFLTGTKTFTNSDIQINMPRILYNKKEIKNFEAILTYGNGILLISDGRAILPGDGDIIFEGQSQSTADGPEVILDIKSNLKNIPELAAWMNWQSVPPAFKSAQFNSKITFRPTEISAIISSLKFDNSSIVGYLTYSYPEGSPQIRTNLTVSNIDLDAYFKSAAPTKTALATLPMLLQQEMKKQTGLENIKATFDITGANITWRTLPISSLRLNGRLDNGILNLTEFSVQEMATANLKMSGVLSGFGNTPFKADNLTVNFAARQLPLFMKRANLESTLPLVTDAENIQLESTISGSPTKWTVDSSIRLSDALMAFQGDIVQSDATNTKFENMMFNMSYPNFKQFLKKTNTTFNLFDTLDGNFKFSGIVTGTANAFSLEDMEFNVGTERLLGTLNVQTQGVKSINGRLHSTLLNIERFLPDLTTTDSSGDWNKNPINFSALDQYGIEIALTADEMYYGLLSLTDSTLEFTVKDKTLKLINLSGKQKKAPSAAFSLAGEASWLQSPTMQGEISFQNIPLRQDFLSFNSTALGDGTLSFMGNVRSNGISMADLIKNLEGSGTLDMNNNTILGMDFTRLEDVVGQAVNERYNNDVLSAQIRQTLVTGKTYLTHGEGKWDIASGVLNAPAVHISTETTVSDPVRLTWDMPRHALEIDLPVKLVQFSDLPTLKISLRKIKTQATSNIDADALVQSLSTQIVKELDSDKLMVAQQKSLQQAAEAQTRTEKIKQAIDEAETAVARAEQLYTRIPSDRALLSLQNAKDALAFIKGIAVKESLTEAQYNQLMEQSRLAVLRARETESEILKNDLLETRRNILGLSQYGEAILKQMQELNTRKPNIASIQKSIAQTQDELKIINDAADDLIQTTNLDQINLVIINANNAFKQIQEQWENVKRFDTTLAIPSVSATAPTTTASTTVRGSLTRRGTN